jgi:hypothetical protein
LSNEPDAVHVGEQPALEPTEEASQADVITHAVPRPSSAVALQSLAPRYEEDQHGTYVARLEQAVKESKNLNIALTGRYGSGKSSVLDEFEAEHRRRTLRLAISTLAPEEEPVAAAPNLPPGATLSTTNRIQKEVVKQLVYGASHKVGKNSRFSRIAVPSKVKVFAQFALTLAFLAAVLFAFDRLPKMRSLYDGQPAWTPYAAWVVLGAVAAALLTAVRLSVHGRFRIADVKAGGASVSLTEQAPSYFDKYLDELVHYFDQESKDIVIFEDLDRFEDPQIFEALRELNILLNDTPRRRRKRRGNRAGRVIAWLIDRLPGNLLDKARQRLSMEGGARLLGTGVPLRFVYAVKDSLFEQLGTDTAALAEAGDVAKAETLRANRTKFFDVVIPLVPFISHRNARELLSGLLEQAGIHDDIDRRLQSVVAKHATDMRLLRNICNEYLVFAERLLESDRVAPKLDHTKLFALVAYKNFHLTDFELIARRGSVLDELYDYKTELVRDEIASHKASIRRLLAQPAVQQQRALAETLGAKLVEVGRVGQASAGYPRGNFPLQFTVAGTEYTQAQVGSYEFWTAVAEHGVVNTVMPNNRPVSITREHLAGILPEFGEPTSWLENDEAARRREVAALETRIEELRGADFIDLIRLTADGGNGAVNATSSAGVTSNVSDAASASPTSAEAKTFTAQVDATMHSDLARDLVKGGFIDQNFTLYAAQFYGTFVGVDVARFMVHNVQPNAMTVDYQFTTPGAVDNLLAEADDEFLHTVAAYNVDIVDHLLATGHPGLTSVVTRLTATHDDDAREFLAAFFTSHGRREHLARELARKPWTQIVTYLVGSEGVPENVRPLLVSAALAAADQHVAYHLDDKVRTYIEHHYLTMPVFTQEQSPEVATTVASVVARAGAVIPVLDPVRALRLRRILVNESRYKLTAANLRTAIGQTESDQPIDLDLVSGDQAVLEFCLAHPDTYLDVVEDDEATKHSVASPEVLAQVLTAVFDAEASDLAQAWTLDTLQRFLRLAAPDSSLQSLHDVPNAAWPALAAAGLFAPTLSNFHAYQGAFGVDKALAAHLNATGLTLLDDGTADDDAKKVSAVAALNAATLEPSARVALVRSLNLEGPIAAELIGAEGNNLFALLLASSLVADDASSFEHFRFGGWDAIRPAVEISEGIASFMDADLLPDMLHELLDHPGIGAKVGHLIVANLDEYLPERDDDENVSALQALARYAARNDTRLPPEVIVRIAKAGAHRDTVLRLLVNSAPAATASNIEAIFTKFGGEYAKVADGPGAEFEVDQDDVHEALLRILKASDIVEYRKVRFKDRYKVEVLSYV